MSLSRSKAHAPTPPSRAQTRVLFASHSHPELTKGGAEISAYQMYKSLSARDDFKAWFLGCVRDQINSKLGATLNQPFDENEYLYAAGGFDWFHFANQDPNFPDEFRKLLKKLQPDIVHFHHYINFGVEALLHVRETLPDAKIVMTLHEYLAICNHFGQMITKGDKSLCYKASTIRCVKCFPERSPADFFLRDTYIKRFFDLVDHFISPSEFLADRFRTWGIDKNKISVIENIIPSPLIKAEETTHVPDEPLRVGFFGQISMLKGINVLMDAAKILDDAEQHNIVFDIFGDYRGQPPEFQKDFLERLAKVGKNVKFHGPYDSSRVDKLMQSVDLVLMPSIWWENSPVVIQEALRNRRPLIVSDIGGMAEKVRDGLDGFHVPVGNGVALASLVRRLNDDRSLISKIMKSMQQPPIESFIVEKHIELYESLSS